MMLPSAIKIKDKIELSARIKVAVFNKEKRKTTPHKHNGYFEIVYLSAGNGSHWIDQIHYKVTSPCIFIIRKEQVHHWDLINPAGYVLLLKKEFIDQSLDRELKKLLIQITHHAVIQLVDTTTIGKIFELLVGECNFTAKEGLFKALLAVILDTSTTYKQVQSNKQNLYHQYRELLTQQNNLTNQVAFYAQLLHTSPQNLNAVCRKAVNQTASQVLGEFIINEAKRLLYYTDNTVSEIAYSLGFVDNSHFSKYFKRFTGLTPQQFRNS